MSHTWNLLPLTALAVLGAITLFSVADGVKIAGAEVTSLDIDGNVIELKADVGGGDLIVELQSVETDTNTEMEITDCNGCNDENAKDDTRLTIDTDAAAGFDGRVDITLTVTCPDDDTITVKATQAGSKKTASFECMPAAASPVPTGTIGAAVPRTVVVQSPNQALSCANTAIVTVIVRDANGQPVAAGTLVNIQASIGAVSPTSGQTTSNGTLTVFYTAPQSQGGTATITATAGTASGSANITINCGAGIQAQPPTTAPGGIRPPSTGDGGIAAGSSWRTYAGIALIVASVLATLALVRPRA